MTTKNKPQLVLRSVRGRIDYDINNYCATCGYKLPKEIMWCPDCKQSENKTLAQGKGNRRKENLAVFIV